MDSRSAGVLVIVVGALIIVGGLLLLSGNLSWLGRLPRDIRIERESVKVYITVVIWVIDFVLTPQHRR